MNIDEYNIDYIYNIDDGFLTGWITRDRKWRDFVAKLCFAKLALLQASPNQASPRLAKAKAFVNRILQVVLVSCCCFSA